MRRFTVEMFPDPELGGFTARVPDIPAYGEGATEDEALADLREALQTYVEAFGLVDALARVNRPVALRDSRSNWKIRSVPKLPRPTGKEMVAFLEKQGFQVVRIRGSHHALAKGSARTMVPVHGGPDAANRGASRDLARYRNEPGLIYRALGRLKTEPFSLRCRTIQAGGAEFSPDRDGNPT